MAQKSHTGGTEKNGSSLLYSKSDLKEGSLQWVPEPPQGQVLLVLSMDNTCPSSSFDMDLCADKLQSLGVQAMAQQLLVIFSACYVRLLVTGRLPRASPGGHLGHSSVPCLCQFIQSTLLCS